jgi:uncharacterized protein (TIGR04255 family)
MSRPKDLPDFESPPVNEVLIGVQFSPIPGYQQILAHEVWALFRDSYPLVEEQDSLEPTFETFGPPKAITGPSLKLLRGATPLRFWFLTAARDELVQFQPDRLMHNWRKVGDGSNEYPRFESMLSKFEAELESLQRYFQKLSVEPLAITQCEITYINHIRGEGGELPNPGDWLRFADFGREAPEGLRTGFARVLNDADGTKRARLVCDAYTAIDNRNQLLLRFDLTVRGAPAGSKIADALDFLRMGRATIVTSFADFTTDQAHKIWRRRQ